MARARERGYPAGGTFAAHDPTQSATAGIEVTISTGGSRQDISTSPQSVIEPVKWTIEKSLPNLTPKEEQEIFGALVCGVLGVGGYDEILTVTLGSNLSWPAFEEWFWRFNEAKFWPSTWELVRDYRELYESNFRQPTDPMLATIYSLSLPARRLSQVPWLLRSDYTNLHDGDFDAATQELLSAGLAVRCEDLPITERLCLLPMSSVRAIQRKHGVNGARSKEQIVKNLLSSIAEEELARELPSDASLKSTVNLQQLDRYQFEHTRAKLLAGTLGDMITHYNRLKQFQDNQHMDGGWPYKMRTYPTFPG
jgi:hypothetical protein